ncbi:MAG TPA: DUF2064 domain-containing protein [Thermoanaerobaculia bacterium]|nr:DUF2064 domain-containing protein [Thermoanaerobaculia bacterium]
MRRALVIFARSPEGEAAAKRLPLHRAAALFRSNLAAWMRAAHAANADVLQPAQRGRTFGERLANAADDAFALGYDAIVITGIDVPACDLDRAFRTMPAIAPARDGGVNLIGLCAPARDLLLTFRPRDGHVAARCRRYFAHLHELPVARDIDTIHDFNAAVCEDRLQPVAGRLKPVRTHFARRISRAPPAI